MASGTPRELREDRMWEAQYLRMIAFPTEVRTPTDQEWWKEVTGAEPESSTRKLHNRVDTGIYDGISLNLEIDPFRVKWTMSPHIDPENLPERFPTLGAVRTRRDWFVEVMRRWFEKAPPISRLAFAGSLLEFVETKEEGYERLNNYLPHTEVDPTTSDFMYRVNRRRASCVGIEGLEVNRLCTWTCVTINIGVHPQAISPVGAPIQPLIDDTNACALELDINTVPGSSGSELPKECLGEILCELVDFGMEVAEKGDI